MFRCPILAACVLTAAALAAESEEVITVPDLEPLLRSDERLAPVVAAAEAHKLQVLVGRIVTADDGAERLVQQGFRVDAEYFYPASTIKLCAAIAALETLERLPGGRVTADTAMTLHARWPGAPMAEADPSNRAGGRITVGHEIRKLFLVSDNEAFNRLYDLVGPDGIERSMHGAGLASVRVRHRLAVSHDAEQHRLLPTVTFATVPPTAVAGRRAPAPAPLPDMPGLDIGRAYLAGGVRHEGAMAFRSKNRISLADLQRLLCQVIRPAVDCGGAAPGRRAFALDDAARTALLDAMGAYPGASRNPVYQASEYPDHWVKFLLPGVERVIPKARVRIVNKIGRAYGFSIENAWVEDTATGDGFFLAAVLYTNANGVLNDDRYGYEEIADPFLADLGETVARAVWALPVRAD